MKKYSTVLQFKESVPACVEVTEAESYFQAIELHRNKIEIGIISKVRLIKNIKFGDGTPEEDDEICQINDYTVGDKIGNGQFGIVYKGYSEDRMVALKRIYKKPLNPPFSMTQIMKATKRYGNANSDFVIMEMNVSKIRWECFVASRLNHDNVMHLLECLDSPFSDQIWLVQPLASLGELAWLRNSKDEVIEQWKIFMQDNLISVEDFSLKVFKDISRGLQYLQLQGIVHRDIKPQNILVDPVNKNLRITDFGCSILIPEKLPFSSKCPSMQDVFTEELNKIVGTPAFTAPELCDFSDARIKLDPSNAFKIDTWSMGVTLYSILNNELPFLGEHEFETYNQIVHKELLVSPKADYNKWIGSYIIKSLLCKDPSGRSSSSACLAALEQHVKPAYSSIRKIRDKVRKIKSYLKKTKKNEESNVEVDIDLVIDSPYSPETLLEPAQKVTHVDLQNVSSPPKKQTIMRSHRATVDLEKYIK